MRKFYMMLAALMVAAITIVACEKTPEEKPKPTPPTPTELTFEVSVADVTRTSAIINVTPSDLEAEYFTVVYSAYTVEQYPTDAELIAKIYAEVFEYAQSQNKTFVEYMAEHTKHGKLENHEVGGLTQATNYYLLVFGVDAANEYTANTAVKKELIALLKFFIITNLPPSKSSTVQLHKCCPARHYLCQLVFQYNIFVEKCQVFAPVSAYCFFCAGTGPRISSSAAPER